MNVMQHINHKLNILFLCTGNSCRSQMAEGYTRALKGDVFQAYSAGVRAQQQIDPLAVEVMKEDDVDISGYHPKTMSDLAGIPFDAVVTVCDHANETCPVFPGKTNRIHRSFEDPPRLASGKNSSDALLIYRTVRDKIKAFVQSLPQALES